MGYASYHEALDEAQAEEEALVASDISTTTFGPLDKYVAANDNEPQAVGFFAGLTEEQKEKALAYRGDENIGSPIDESDSSAGFPVSSDNGQYIGLTRNQPAEPKRHGQFMQTFTGRKYWPCNPVPNEVFIEDIAHALSLQCRYAGHCLRFYSVAEHSVLIARHLAAKHAPEVALAGLLHDASEAYCVDIPRPLKPYLTNYKDIEERNWKAIAARYRLSSEIHAEVHDADNRIIADELANLVPMAWHARYAGQELGVNLRYWSPEKAEVEFLATFDALMAGRA